MIKLIKPYIEYGEIENEFKEVFDSGFFTRGKYSNLLPKKMCDYTKAQYAFNTTSATTALSVCLNALSIKEGDEVLVSDFSFPASVNVIENCGAKPVFVDVSLDTFNMRSDDLSNKITEKSKAVIFVSSFGNPSGIKKIKKICRENNLILIDDAACAIGSSIDGIKSGNISDFSCFSFHPRKLLTSGEGGAITTNLKKYAKILDIILMHGAKAKENGFNFVKSGYNYRLPELQSIMIIKQLEKLDAIVQERIEIQREYSKVLEPLGYKQQIIESGVIHNIQSLVYRVPDNVRRDELIKYLKENNIESTIGTYCLSNCTYYKEKYNCVQRNALELENTTITLPCYNSVDIDYITKKIGEYNV